VNGRCLSNAADGRPAGTDPQQLAGEQPVDLPVLGELVVRVQLVVDQLAVPLISAASASTPSGPRRDTTSLARLGT
jgi:hypothetical protein